MHVIRARNVNGAFGHGLRYLLEAGVRSESRGGPVIVAPCPVMTVYERPCERVLLEPRRDANPFFHLFEGLWILAGRDDARSLNRYVRDFGRRFAEVSSLKLADDVYNEHGIVHDAYGHRWRHALGFDQLDHIVRMLRDDPGTRQAVLQMWDASPVHGVELSKHGVGDVWENAPADAGSDDLRGEWRGRPCNTHVYFRVREMVEALVQDYGRVPSGPVLDMTICCRSNDVVWGAYGANAVHFSMLMEYVAGRAHLHVGTMYQLSNNFHGYVDALDRLGDPAELSLIDPYDEGEFGVASAPMGTSWEQWDLDLSQFMQWHDLENQMLDRHPVFANDWFQNVAVPMCVANQLRRQGSLMAALEAIEDVDAQDWYRAGHDWLTRRLKNKPIGETVGDVR